MTIHKELEPEVDIGEGNDAFCPLRAWNTTIENLTLLKKEADVKPIYKGLIKSVNKNCYNKQLSEEPMLFV